MLIVFFVAPLIEESDSRERSEIRAPVLDCVGGREDTSPTAILLGGGGGGLETKEESDLLLRSPVLRRKPVQRVKRQLLPISIESEDSLSPMKLFIVDN